MKKIYSVCSIALLQFKTFPGSILKVIFCLVCGLLAVNYAHAQWLDWANETDTRLIVSSVANSDDEEKDMWVADIDNDGDDDLIVCRKEPFSAATEPGKTALLLMNEGGILTDRTLELAPQFIDSICFARDVFIGDFDGDNWKDVVIANTFGQQPMYYRNLGSDLGGHWLGLVNESSLRFPFLDDDEPQFCALWGADVTGEGSPDIYFMNYKPNSGGGTALDYLLINNGSGFFTNESQARLGNLRNSAFGTAVQFRDMDNDGDYDVIKNSTLYNVSPWNAKGIIVLFNNGDGTFTNWQNLVPSSSPYMFEVADFNNDGKKDLFIVDDGSDYLITVSAINPNTSLTFTKTNLNFSSSNSFGGNVHAADLDLDGYLDIGIADVDVDIPPCNSSRRLAIYRNINGTFSDPYSTTAFTWADNSYDFAFLDINNDGLQDFITGFCGGYGVYMNDNCALAPNPSDYDGDGLADACDPCPTNPDSLCAPPTEYPVVPTTGFTIARQWNELLLASIRKDLARPTVHARNLFHISAAMWDAWSAYDPNSEEFLLGKTVGGFSCPFSGVPDPQDIKRARTKAISYAAYRLLKHRFANSPQAALLSTAYDVHMDSLGYNINDTSTNYISGNPAALGNYIAKCYIDFGLQDGSNEQNGYANTSYAPINPPLNVDVPGNPNLIDFNRWQPLTLDLFIDQSGNIIPGATPPFLSPEWGQVTPFSLDTSDLIINNRDGFDYLVYHDPGPPPLLQMDGQASGAYKYGFSLVSIWSSHLTANDGVVWDISPATQGNRNNLPTNFSDYPQFYKLIEGGTISNGYDVNPKTGQPYRPNKVPRGDYARVLAEFWADGPESETPPGHWFTLFNYVSDHPLATTKYRGMGPSLDRLEWDVKGYFALGGTMHDVAVSVWGMKGWYDYIRPISAIRGMAALGQCSDSTAMSYHPAGLPLIPGYIELVLSGDSLANDPANIGKIKLKAWRGHDFINNVDVDEAGVGWILAENWLPYQRPSFVTPPFAGYISGHSTYSRAAAEMLAEMTGDEYFPGGLGEFTAKANEFLVFEDGPSVDVTLQWAKYQDAADESSMSRIWGGIHPPCDDIPGRILGQEIGEDAFSKAEEYFFPCTSAPAAPHPVSGTSSGVCGQTNVPYSVPFVQGVVYNWSVPSGATIVSGQNTNSIVVDFTGSVNSGTVSVIAANTCGSSAPGAKMVTTTPGTPHLIRGPATVCSNQTGVPYSILAVPSATNYKWIAPQGAHISDGITTSVSNTLVTSSPNITVNYGSAEGGLKVKAFNSCGAGDDISIAIHFTCKAEESSAQLNPHFGIFPNPTTGYVTITGSGLNDGLFKIILTNVIGKVLIEKEVVAETGFIETQADIGTLPVGTYFVTISSEKTEKIFKVQKQ